MIPDWLSQGLPVRSGGKNANEERVALDALGGPAGFKTREVRLADGTVMRVQTKGDMPPQVTRVKEVAQPEQTEWRLWHGLISIDRDGERVNIAGDSYAPGSMPLRDWGAGGGYRDGDTVKAFVRPMDFNGYGPELIQGCTYYSNFAMIPKDKQKETRAVGDYGIAYTLKSPWPLFTDEYESNDPFDLLEGGGENFSWPWKAPDGSIYLLSCKSAAVLPQAPEITVRIYIRALPDGKDKLIAEEVFSQDDVNPDPDGDTKYNRLLGRICFFVEHSPSGASALLFYGYPIDNGINHNYRMAEYIEFILRADVKNENEAALSLFRNNASLTSVEEMVESNWGTPGGGVPYLRTTLSCSGEARAFVDSPPVLDAKWRAEGATAYRLYDTAWKRTISFIFADERLGYGSEPIEVALFMTRSTTEITIVPGGDIKAVADRTITTDFGVRLEIGNTTFYENSFSTRRYHYRADFIADTASRVIQDAILDAQTKAYQQSVLSHADSGVPFSASASGYWGDDIAIGSYGEILENHVGSAGAMCLRLTNNVFGLVTIDTEQTRKGFGFDTTYTGFYCVLGYQPIEAETMINNYGEANLDGDNPFSANKVFRSYPSWNPRTGELVIFPREENEVPQWV